MLCGAQTQLAVENFPIGSLRLPPEFIHAWGLIKACAVRVEPGIARYIVALAGATRSHTSLKMGSSPRGTLIHFRTTQARAYLSGRDYAIPEDVKDTAVSVLAHRLALDTKAKYSGVAKEDVVREILEKVSVGV